MKNYIKPEILEEKVEIEDICASSGIGNNVVDDFNDNDGDGVVCPF